MSRTKAGRPRVLGPFTEESVRQWNEALSACEAALRECELALQAGLPCQDDLQACTAIRDQLAQIKATYAPGYP